MEWSKGQDPSSGMSRVGRKSLVGAGAVRDVCGEVQDKKQPPKRCTSGAGLGEGQLQLQLQHSSERYIYESIAASFLSSHRLLLCH